MEERKNEKQSHFYFSNSPPRTKMCWGGGQKISKNTDIHIYVYIKTCVGGENSIVFRRHHLVPTYHHNQREITFF